MAGSPAMLPGLMIVAVLVVLSVGFGVRQWLDRRRREMELNEADARYFARQDARRLGGSTLMLLIAAGMVAGLTVDPRVDPQSGRLWGFLWLAVTLLVIGLLVLGMADWLDLRTYAARQRRTLHAERLAVIEAERRRLDEVTRSHAEPESSDGSPRA